MKRHTDFREVYHLPHCFLILYEDIPSHSSLCHISITKDNQRKEDVRK